MLIEKAIKNLSFDASIRAKSSISILEHVDQMIESFKNRKDPNKSDILLDVFGLLQSLFVGIDSLYQLVIATTKYKYHVNINANKNLRKLKFLRNDVVGHPTNRSYEDGSFGFSIILNDQITREKISYENYIIKGRHISKSRQTINFQTVLIAYENEKKKVINDLKSFLGRSEMNIETTGLIVELFEKGLKGVFNIDDLKVIQKKFMKEQRLNQGSSHRFIWRINVLKKLFLWKDETYQDIIDYGILKHIQDLYGMNQNLNNKKIRMPILDTPPLMREISNFFNVKPDAKKLLTHLNDKADPLFNIELNALISMTTGHIKDFLLWFLQIGDHDHSFLIGKMLKDLK